MTPKEKAEDLVNQYRMILMDEDTDCGNEILCSLIAIKNAKIAVDEILHYISRINETHQGSILNDADWLKVKDELNGL